MDDELIIQIKSIYDKILDDNKPQPPEKPAIERKIKALTDIGVDVDAEIEKFIYDLYIEEFEKQLKSEKSKAKGAWIESEDNVQKIISEIGINEDDIHDTWKNVAAPE